MKIAPFFVDVYLSQESTKLVRGKTESGTLDADFYSGKTRVCHE